MLPGRFSGDCHLPTLSSGRKGRSAWGEQQLQTAYFLLFQDRHHLPVKVYATSTHNRHVVAYSNVNTERNTKEM
jgi:hypothetical protein